ncbi:type II secretion system F family protein [Mesorhizobium xinjiangense]|uniref:type II secretion system F family protein n=1 Tax=Mesorhizobium xinjiangense TaxID=2678685 RepID=UPI0012EE62B9|nr:type II secretion system F family protein [Mesorhizobium xinjiangense]
MFGIDPTIILIFVLAGVSAGAAAYAVMFNRIEDERTTDRRLDSIKKAETDRTVVKAARDRVTEVAKRRKAVQDSLKELDERQKSKDQHIRKPPLKLMLKQAGLSVTVGRFYLYSAICGLALAVVALIAGAPLWAVPGALVVGGLGLPRWTVIFLRKRRITAFLDELPNALDVIVRSVKSGLPLNDSVRLIASEAREPVRGEFRRIVESQQLGISIPEACMRMQETTPCPEAGFFGIVIQIQSQAGGNLSEALGNLSRVLRDRRKMKAKIQAISMEAKSSAAIIGALPFIVAVLVSVTSPNYLVPLFTTSTGHIILGVSAIWMCVGIFVMRNMINFEI